MSFLITKLIISSLISILLGACVQMGGGGADGSNNVSPMSQGDQGGSSAKKKVFVKPPTGMIVLSAYSEIDLSKFIHDHSSAAYFSVNSENMVVVIDYDEAIENPKIKIMDNSNSSKHLVIAYSADGIKIGSQEF